MNHFTVSYILLSVVCCFFIIGNFGIAVVDKDRWTRIFHGALATAWTALFILIVGWLA